MHSYLNKTGKSGVRAYQIGDDYIAVRFVESPRIYTYSYAGAGKEHVEAMKLLAQEGEGLSTYISRFVSDLYD